MVEIPEDPERDAIIDAMMNELKDFIVATTKNDTTSIMMREIYEDCIKDRMKDLFNLAVQRATLYDR